jgi:predicted nucleic-acid-binding Zn-ribbon protein
MKRSGKCPKCGSTEIVADAKAIDRGHGNAQLEMSVATFRKPEALLFKEKQVSTVSAWVCTECGYIEFYADSPQTIRLSKT